MIILIAGGTHSGKTLLAQQLLEKHHYPYLSIDHLKMGLIRSGHCSLRPESDDESLTAFLWPIVREIILTVIENGQNLIVEGCYIPFDYRRYFDAAALAHIRYICLIFSAAYIEAHYDEILANADAIERRQDTGGCTKALLLEENARMLAHCRKHGCAYRLIEDADDAARAFRATGSDCLV